MCRITNPHILDGWIANPDELDISMKTTIFVPRYA